MSEKALKFGNIVSNKKEFHASKKPIALNLVGTDKMIISDRFKHNDRDSKYFIGYFDDDIIRPLCIVLLQMSGYIKYFDDGGKNMSFKIEDDDIYLKYNEIWNKIKKTLNITFPSQPIYDEKYIKTKVKIFDDVINTIFQTMKFHKIEIITIAICIDSVIKIDEKKLSLSLSRTT